jgi:hypothetical protein
MGTTPRRFPGMDPYLEAAGIWPGFHDAFFCVREALQPVLPAKYYAELNTREEVGISGCRDYAVPPAVSVKVRANTVRQDSSPYGGCERVVMTEVERAGDTAGIPGSTSTASRAATSTWSSSAAPACATRVSNLTSTASPRSTPCPWCMPLLPPDQDIALDLGPVFARAYDTGPYRKILDYARPPDPDAAS